MRTPGLTTQAAEINVTPMLDVLMVLLVIFMVVTSTMRHAIDVQLPEPCTGKCVGDTPTIVLEVLPGPTYRLNQQTVTGSLADKLRSVYAGRPDKIIAVLGAPDVRYDQVVSAMDVARGAGVRVISIAPRRSTTRY